MKERRNVCFLRTCLFLRQSFIVSGTENGVDICFASPKLFWVNNGHNLILTNTQGDDLHRVNGSHSCALNIYELVYINWNFSIQKLSYHTKEMLHVMAAYYHTLLSINLRSIGWISSFPYPHTDKVVRYNHVGAFVFCINILATSQKISIKTFLFLM